MKMTRTIAAVAALALSASAYAGSVTGYNVDFDVTGGAGGGVPSNAFGAASGQTGIWNGIDPGGAGGAIVDINGANPVNLSFAGGFQYSFDEPNTTGDDALLMDDIMDPGAAVLLTISGLPANSLWNVYTYAMAPDSNAFLTDVSVAQSGDPLQTVGGDFSGGYLLGVTHALHTNALASSGTITINIATNSGFGSANGFQLVQVIPAPGAIALLGLAGLASRRRRRA